MSKYFNIADVRYDPGEEAKALQRIKEIEAYLDRYLDTPIINDEFEPFVFKEGRIERTTSYVTDEGLTTTKNGTDTRPERQELRTLNGNDTITQIINRQHLTTLFAQTAETGSQNLDKTTEETRTEKRFDGDLFFKLTGFFDSQAPSSAGNETFYRRFSQHILNYAVEIRTVNYSFPTPPTYTWTVELLSNQYSSRLGVRAIITPIAGLTPSVRVTSQKNYPVDASKTKMYFSFDYLDAVALSRDTYASNVNYTTSLVFTLADGTLVTNNKSTLINFLDLPSHSSTFSRSNTSFSIFHEHDIPATAISVNHTLIVENISNGGRASFDYHFSNIRLYYKRFDWGKLKAIALEGYHDNLNPSLTVSKALNDNDLLLENTKPILRAFVL